MIILSLYLTYPPLPPKIKIDRPTHTYTHKHKHTQTHTRTDAHTHTQTHKHTHTHKQTHKRARTPTHPGCSSYKFLSIHTRSYMTLSNHTRSCKFGSLTEIKYDFLEIIEG